MVLVWAAAPSPFCLLSSFAGDRGLRISVTPKKRKGRIKPAGLNAGATDFDVTIARAGQEGERATVRGGGSPAILATMPESP